MNPMRSGVIVGGNTPPMTAKAARSSGSISTRPWIDSSGMDSLCRLGTGLSSRTAVIVQR